MNTSTGSTTLTTNKLSASKKVLPVRPASPELQRGEQAGLAPILIIIIVTIVLTVAGYLGYRWFQSMTKAYFTRTVDNIVNKINGKATSSSSTQTSNWQTYTNNKNGFTIQYPPDATLAEIQEPPGIVSRLKISFIGLEDDKEKYQDKTLSWGGIKNGYQVGLEFLNIPIKSIESWEQSIRDNYKNRQAFNVCSKDAGLISSGMIDGIIAGKKAIIESDKNCLKFHEPTFDETINFTVNRQKKFSVTVSYVGSPTAKTTYKTITDQIISSLKFFP